MSPSATTNPLSRKLQKVLSLKLDQDPELLTALQGLSSVVSTNTLRARRNLRGDFERRGVELSVELCDTFVSVNNIVDNLCSEIDEMAKSCDVMFEQLTTARKQMSGLLEKTSTLKKESAVVEMKADVVKAFIARYQITPQQSAALRRSNVIDQDFFDALTRVKRIHDDCKVLVQTHQTAGLQIMESMALQQENGYECLYRWCQNECRHLNSDVPEAGPILKQGLDLLGDRAVLHKTCLEELQKARRAATVRMFINALTKGGPMGTPKPMELSSHDPIRYAGDMLAWLHQAIASERDFLTSLLEDKESVSTVLGHITEGLCRTLKVRVEQILSAEQDCLVLQRISNLTKFYLATIKNFLPTDSELVVTISELCKACDRQFNSSVTLNISRLGDRGELPGLDLVPTVAFQEALHLLKIVLNNHDVSVVPDVNPVAEMIQLANVVVSPIIAMCYTTASELEYVSGAVYVINTLHYLRDLLSLYENTDKKLEELDKQITEQLKLLTTTQTEHMIQCIDLSNAELILSAPNLPTPLSTSLTPEYISDVSNKLDKALCQVESLTLTESKLLCSLKHRTIVWSKGCKDLLSRYERLYNLVTDPQHSYPPNILSKTPAQIKELMK